MNILITGAKGNLGEYMSRYFSKDNHVISLGKNELNVLEREKLFNTIKLINPNIIIHNAAINDIDFCEKDEHAAYTTNTIGTLNVAYICSHLNIPIIYISSSYVFNGKKKSPYYETDFCEPINTFGKTH